MDPDFWHQRWESNQIGFHESGGNDLLIEHFDVLTLAGAARVFVPLCGKTVDIGWLLAQGHCVVGVELSELAVRQLFKTLGIEADIQKIDDLVRYSAPGIDIFAGDIFALTQALLGPVDAVYDRAALVALPEDLRAQYTTHLAPLTGAAQQLLITFEYDQALAAGPPFSIKHADVIRYYSSWYEILTITSRRVAGGLKGKIDATESVYLLRKK